MADLNDVQNYGRKFQNQLVKLEEANIPESDRQAIQGFIQYEDSNGRINTGTLTMSLNRIRLSSERSEIPLTEAAKEDIDSLLFSLKHDYGLKDGTLREYRKALRKFYKWCGVSWSKEIKIGPSPTNNADPSKILTEDEINDMLDAAENPRNKAAIALLADTGMRIGAVASLRIRDLDLSGRIGTVSVNEEANVKNASGSVPLTWSRGYVANWLDVHPRSNEFDAPLIHKMGGHYTGEDDGALTYQYLSRCIREIGNKAGVEDEKLNTHNFRKSAITRWIREGMSEQKIKHRAFWAKDSSQFEIYSGITEEELNSEIAHHYGLVDEEETARPALEECPQCRTPLRDDSRYCPGCGTPLTAAASETVDRAEGNLFSDAASSKDEQATDTLQGLHTALQENPEFRELLDNYS